MIIFVAILISKVAAYTSTLRLMYCYQGERLIVNIEHNWYRSDYGESLDEKLSLKMHLKYGKLMGVNWLILCLNSVFIDTVSLIVKTFDFAHKVLSLV